MHMPGMYETCAASWYLGRVQLEKYRVRLLSASAYGSQEDFFVPRSLFQLRSLQFSMRVYPWKQQLWSLTAIKVKARTAVVVILLLCCFVLT